MVVCARPRREPPSRRLGGLLLLAHAACFNPTGTDPVEGSTTVAAAATGTTGDDTTAGTTGAPTTGTTAPASTGPDGACADPSDCPEDAPFCDPDTATCVQCLAADDCPVAAPICDPTLHLCRPCDDHGDCELACDLELGTCFPGGDDTKILVTDPTIPCPPDCVDVPCCSIAQALQQAAKLSPSHSHFVVEVGGGTDGAAVVVTAASGLGGRRIAVIGQPPGRILTAPGVVLALDQSAVAEPARLFVSGLAIVGGDTSNGVLCSNAPGLWLDHVRLTGHRAGYGVNVAQCTIHLRHSFVMDNTGGLYAQSGRLELRNVIVGGSTIGSEVHLATNAELDAVYTTIVDDSPGTAGALLRCSAAKQLRIDNGLILGLGGGPESLDCSPIAHVTRSAVSPGLFTTLFDTDVVIPAPRDDIPFVSWDPPRSYLLKQTDDPLAGVAAWQPGYPTIDIDGTRRPTDPGAPDYPGADIPNQ